MYYIINGKESWLTPKVKYFIKMFVLVLIAVMVACEHALTSELVFIPMMALEIVGIIVMQVGICTIYWIAKMVPKLRANNSQIILNSIALFSQSIILYISLLLSLSANDDGYTLASKIFFCFYIVMKVATDYFLLYMIVKFGKPT